MGTKVAVKDVKWERDAKGKAILSEVADAPITAGDVAVVVSEIPTPAPEIKQKKVLTPPRPGMTRCKYCGKWMSKEEAVENERGDKCKHLREELGLTPTDLLAHRKSRSSDTIPVNEKGDQHVKIAQVDRLCKRLGIPISRLVKTFGGDRSMEPALHPWFEITYVGNARYVDARCITEEGLDIIRSAGGELRGKQAEGTTKRAKKELAEALTAPE